MTIFRLIPFALHGAIEFVAGAALLVAPFLFGFTPAGLVVSVLIGALVVGLALSTVADADARQGGMPIAAHVGFDRTLVLALLVAAALLGAASDVAAASCLAILALAELALSVTTRYSVPVGGRRAQIFP